MTCKSPPSTMPAQDEDISLETSAPAGFDLQQELLGNDWLQSILPTAEDETCLPETAPAPATEAAKGAGAAAKSAAESVKKPTTMEDLYAQKVDSKTSRWRKMTPQEALLHKVESQFSNFLGIKGPQQKEAGYTQEVNGETYVYGPGSDDEQLQVKDMVGPSANQFIGRAFASDVQAPGGVGPTQKKLVVLNPDGSVTEQVANNHGMVQLPGATKNPKDKNVNPNRPTPFLGYKSYNMNDVHNTVGKKKVEQNDQYSSTESMASMINLSLDYQTMFPDSCLQIGDISTETGGSPNQKNNSKPHGTHYDGTQFDLRYVKGKEAQVIGEGKPKLDASDKLRTKALLELAKGQGFNNFYLGSALDGQFGSGIKYNGDHNNHMHFGIGPGVTTTANGTKGNKTGGKKGGSKKATAKTTGGTGPQVAKTTAKQPTSSKGAGKKKSSKSRKHPRG